MFQCQKHSASIFHINYFNWRTDIFPLLGIFTCCTLFMKSTYFHQQKRVNWFNKPSYKNKYIAGLHYDFELAISTLSATLQAGDLIDQVDRERGANRNQSRGIKFIHAKRLTHHPNTRYKLPVMDSTPDQTKKFARQRLANTFQLAHGSEALSFPMPARLALILAQLAVGEGAKIQSLCKVRWFFTLTVVLI